jgi:hypothetical protein
MLIPDGTGNWHGWIDTSSLTEQQKLHVRVTATSQKGNWVESNLDPVTVEASAPPPAVKKPAPKKKAKPVKKEKAPIKKEKAPKDAEKPVNSNLKNILLFGGINLAIIILGGIGYWFYRKRKGNSSVQLLDDEDMDEDMLND